MASQRIGSKKGHSRNASQPTTSAGTHKWQPIFQTTSGRQPGLKVPSTAPMPRTSVMRTLRDTCAQPLLPVPHTQTPPSDGKISASDRGGDIDSDAETEILKPKAGDEVTESQAARAAS